MQCLSLNYSSLPPVVLAASTANKGVSALAIGITVVVVDSVVVLLGSGAGVVVVVSVVLRSGAVVSE